MPGGIGFFPGIHKIKAWTFPPQISLDIPMSLAAFRLGVRKPGPASATARQNNQTPNPRGEHGDANLHSESPQKLFKTTFCQNLASRQPQDSPLLYRKKCNESIDMICAIQVKKHRDASIPSTPGPISSYFTINLFAYDLSCPAPRQRMIPNFHAMYLLVRCQIRRQFRNLRQ